MTLIRRADELETIDECVEEILVRYSQAFAHARQRIGTEPPPPRLYDQILEVLLRAREVPPLSIVPDSPPLI